jgi:hypothetical protein
MKVLVQDSSSGRYLSADGDWVDALDARDFQSILPAYQYALRNTSVRFHITLYFLEDDYRAIMITGIGNAPVDAPTDQEVAACARALRRLSHPVRFDEINFPVRICRQRLDLN